MIGIIAAMTATRVIGQNGKIPWSHPEDLARFRRITTGSTIIMGRLTAESLPIFPLPDRRNIVVTATGLSTDKAGLNWKCARSVAEALKMAEASSIWFIGGTRIFEEGLAYAQIIDLTVVPDVVQGAGLVFFPPIPDRFELVRTTKPDRSKIHYYALR